MKFYLAASYGRFHEIRQYSLALEEAGHIVTSSWCKGEYLENDADLLSPQYEHLAHEVLATDLGDLSNCDALVAFTESGDVSARGGRHVEMGIAIGMGKRLFVVGCCENLFYLLAEHSRFDTFDDFLRWLSSCDDPEYIDLRHRERIKNSV
ncbi:hypothetical protein [Ferrimicrobium acidiphilum]|uniref:hypothetical protein n=1 Tax=Ferrimicrobium acidiphilum TaxID=121039 RepID=UPI0023F4ECDE|nr:hypothetical protein [Ferrimicrobium acidiphilum]